MAWTLDESFAAGIPASFASMGGGGQGSVTYNSAQQAVDLSFTLSQSFWALTSLANATDWWFEMDVELVSRTHSCWHFGFWMSDGVGYEGHRFATNQPSGQTSTSWQLSSWGSGGNEYSSFHGMAFPALWATTGSRHTIRLDARHAGQANMDFWAIQITVDGVVAAKEYRQYYAGGLRPSIFGYGCVLRVHSVKGATGSALAAPSLVGANARTVDLLRVFGTTPPTVAVQVKASAVNLAHHFGPFSGNGRISGTVKEKSLPTNVPVWRRVVLMDQRTHTPLREMWSDRLTGAYQFDQLALDRKYLVISYDHNGNYKAVIADTLTASPLS